MAKVKIASVLPKQCWSMTGKLNWLDQTIRDHSADLWLLPQEYFGGGSCREICRLKGIATDDHVVSVEWLAEEIGGICRRYGTHIGVGATVRYHDWFNAEDYLFFNPPGELIGYRSKMALPVQDSVLTNGDSQVTPEDDVERATTPVEIPELGLRIGVVFCWEVFFNRLWQSLADKRCNLVVHPIKFAPRAWYKKGTSPITGRKTRIGFTQNKGSNDPHSDDLGWIRKLKYESEFKDLPIAVTCNTWEGGEKYLALVGWVEETTRRTNLFNVPSIQGAEKIVITEYDPSLYDALDRLSLAQYGKFKEHWATLMSATMRRKAARIERRLLTASHH